MTSKLTREQLHERARENVKALKLASRQTAFESAREEILADLQLAELALAAINSDPVAYAWVSRSGKKHLTRCEPEQWRDAVIVTPLYSHAQPAPERDQVRSEHAEWSQATFGNVGPVGPLKHLSKEALEAAADPEDLSEWADMQFLLWDAQRRAGITDEQITQAMIEKMAVNKQREWPEPKDGEPRLHIKEQPAPVVPVTDAMAYAFHHALTDSPLGDDDVEDIKAGLRAALVNVFDTQPAPVVQMVPEEPPEHRLPKGNSRDTTYRRGAIILGWKLCRAAMLAAAPQLPGSEPATVPGKWIPVSERLPEVGVKVLCYPVKDEPIHATFNGQLWLQDVSWSGSDEPIDNVITANVTHWMPLPAAPQEVR
ncbi:hypothetical protein SB02110_05297 [Klebsiella quasipneumoniae subsp. quasipneumoniae]|nr:hypothetical protein SB02110_05297 [Klebsiella quasipneumoniae subsp. quasipneumoniae]